MSSSCIYITGASGFIGKNLIKAFKKKISYPIVFLEKNKKTINSIIIKTTENYLQKKIVF